MFAAGHVFNCIVSIVLVLALARTLIHPFWLSSARTNTHTHTCIRDNSNDDASTWFLIIIYPCVFVIHIQHGTLCTIRRIKWLTFVFFRYLSASSFYFFLSMWNKSIRSIEEIRRSPYLELERIDCVTFESYTLTHIFCVCVFLSLLL